MTLKERNLKNKLTTIRMSFPCLSQIFYSFSYHIFVKTSKYHERDLKDEIGIGNRAGKGRAYGNVGNAYQSPADYRKGIEYDEKQLKIAVEFSDEAGEGRAWGNLGIADKSQGDFPKSIEYHEKGLKIALEIGDQAGEGKAEQNLGIAYQSPVDYRKTVGIQKNLKNFQVSLT